MKWSGIIHIRIEDICKVELDDNRKVEIYVALSGEGFLFTSSPFLMQFVVLL